MVNPGAVDAGSPLRFFCEPEPILRHPKPSLFFDRANSLGCVLTAFLCHLAAYICITHRGISRVRCLRS